MDTAKQLTIKNLRRKRKMAVNKVDYEVLTSGVSVYANQAEALDEVIQDKPDSRCIYRKIRR